MQQNVKTFAEGIKIHLSVCWWDKPSFSCPGHVSPDPSSSPEFRVGSCSAPNTSTRLAERHGGREARTSQSSPGRDGQKRLEADPWLRWLCSAPQFPPLPSSECAGISCRSFRTRPPARPASGGSAVCPSGPGAGSCPAIHSDRCSRRPEPRGGSSDLKTGSWSWWGSAPETRGRWSGSWAAAAAKETFDCRNHPHTLTETWKWTCLFGTKAASSVVNSFHSDGIKSLCVNSEGQRARAAQPAPPLVFYSV